MKKVPCHINCPHFTHWIAMHGLHVFTVTMIASCSLLSFESTTTSCVDVVIATIKQTFKLPKRITKKWWIVVNIQGIELPLANIYYSLVHKWKNCISLQIAQDSQHSPTKQWCNTFPLGSRDQQGIFI